MCLRRLVRFFFFGYQANTLHRSYVCCFLYQDAGKFQAAFATIMSGNMDALKKPEKKKEERKEKKDIKEKKDVPA